MGTLSTKYCLHEAVQEQNYERITELLKSPDLLDVDELDEDCETALDVAASLGDYRATEMLLRCGAKPSLQSSYSRPTATLYNALSGGNVDVIARLVAHGCDPSILISSHFPDRKLDSWPLHTFWDFAILANNPKVIKCLLDSCPEVAKDKEKLKRLLLTAVDRDSSGIIEVIVKYNAALGDPRDLLIECLGRALSIGSIGTFYMLLRRGADPSACGSEDGVPGPSLLHQAIEQRRPEFAAVLLAAKASVDPRNDAGETPLHVAVKKGCADSVLNLLKAGADANACDGAGNRPLHLAASASCKPVIEALLRFGADVNAVDAAGSSALHIAAAGANARALLLMLLKGSAKVDLEDGQARSALQVAVDSRNLDAVKWLLDYGAQARRLRLQAQPTMDLAARSILAQAAIRRVAANLRVEPRLRELYDLRGKLEAYARRCEEELMEMRHTSLHNGISFYDLLHLNARNLVSLIKQPRVRDTFKNVMKSKRWTIYVNLINFKFITGERLEHHYDMAATSLLIMSEFRFPKNVLDKILEHLDEFDMSGLVSLNYCL